MKSKFFCTVVFLAIGTTSSAQENRDSISRENSKYWNISFSSGISRNINTYSEKTGVNYNIDASYIPVTAQEFLSTFLIPILI